MNINNILDLFTDLVKKRHKLESIPSTERTSKEQAFLIELYEAFEDLINQEEIIDDSDLI